MLKKKELKPKEMKRETHKNQMGNIAKNTAKKKKKIENVGKTKYWIIDKN